MASSEHRGNIDPAFLGGDLPQPENTAYKEGYDADTTPAEGISTPSHAGGAVLEKETAAAFTQVHSRDNTSSHSSGDSGVVEHDPEKAQPTDQTTETKDELDPNVVTWDSDDDPQNPQNW
jgi:hypothetical protein